PDRKHYRHDCRRTKVLQEPDRLRQWHAPRRLDPGPGRGELVGKKDDLAWRQTGRRGHHQGAQWQTAIHRLPDPRHGFVDGGNEWRATRMEITCPGDRSSAVYQPPKPWGTRLA